MKRCNIGIIGGAGRMGKWFSRFFEAAGHRVHGVEARENQDMQSVARSSDVVVISVPIGKTCKVIEELGPFVRPESLLMDLTSLKVKPVEWMVSYSRSEVIGTHPLFGPDAEDLQGQTIILCPARAEKWLLWLTDLLSAHGARLEIISPEKHDKIMAIVQAMGHMSTLLMGLLLKELNYDPNDLKRYCTPLFRIHMSLIGRLFSQDPRLYAELIALNPEAKRPLAMYSSLLDKLKRWVDEGKTDEISGALAEASHFFDPAKTASFAADKDLIKAVTDST